MRAIDEQSAIEFHRYPPVGEEDWSYSFATARARVLECALLGRGFFMDMINAGSFAETVELLSGTDYSMSAGVTKFAEVETVLRDVRSGVRRLFVELLPEADYIELLRARVDFTNMRLAIRRVVTERPIGTDYSDEGNVAASELEEIFEQENYGLFPMYLQEGVEQAVLGYYSDKDIRRIDYGIDKAQAEYKLDKSRRIGSVFLLSWFRSQIDLNNIRTMLRLKMADRDERVLFIEGGFVNVEMLVHGLNAGYDTLGTIFYPTPYSDVVDGGVSYLTAKESFLGLERLCEEHLMGFLKTTRSIAAGPQPVIAYFLMKENEIRTMRMVLTGKYNSLDSKLLVDRLGDHG